MGLEVLRLNILSIVLSQVVRGRPTGIFQSVGGLSAAAMIDKVFLGGRASQVSKET